MKSPSLFKVAVIIVTVWIIFVYQQYLHTATYDHVQSAHYMNYAEFDPIRHIPLCRDNITTTVLQTQRYVLDGRSDDNEETGRQCQRELDRVTVHMPDHVPGLTQEDYERSIAHVGNRYRLARFVQKLIQSTTTTMNTDSNSTASDSNTESNNNKAVTVVVCGGSITMGHGVEPQAGRYSDALEVWLNDAYPVAVETNSSTKDDKKPNIGDYNYRNDYPNRHRVYTRGGHGANVRVLHENCSFSVASVVYGKTDTYDYYYDLLLVRSRCINADLLHGQALELFSPTTKARFIHLRICRE
jgi:hypothetical protein